jgi:hypothetical protein
VLAGDPVAVVVEIVRVRWIFLEVSLGSLLIGEKVITVVEVASVDLSECRILAVRLPSHQQHYEAYCQPID